MALTGQAVLIETVLGGFAAGLGHYAIMYYLALNHIWGVHFPDSCGYMLLATLSAALSGAVIYGLFARPREWYIMLGEIRMV